VDFRIDDGVACAAKREVGSSWGANGIATRYRVSESSNFGGANWISGADPAWRACVVNGRLRLEF
jgi:hypothetical protein